MMREEFYWVDGVPASDCEYFEPKSTECKLYDEGCKCEGTKCKFKIQNSSDVMVEPKASYIIDGIEVADCPDFSKSDCQCTTDGEPCEGIICRYKLNAKKEAFKQLDKALKDYKREQYDILNSLKRQINYCISLTTFNTEKEELTKYYLDLLNIEKEVVNLMRSQDIKLC